MQRTPNVRHPGPDPAARAQHPRAPPTSRRRLEPLRVLPLAPPSPVRALAVRAPRAALALLAARPCAAGRRRPPNPNVYFLVKFENMDYMSSNLFTNYVVTY